MKVPDSDWRITQRLIKKMGGSIHLESTPGKGSVFTVILENVASVPRR